MTPNSLILSLLPIKWQAPVDACCFKNYHPKHQLPKGCLFFVFVAHTCAGDLKTKNPKPNKPKTFTLWSEAAGILITAVIINWSMVISFCYPLFFQDRLSCHISDKYHQRQDSFFLSLNDMAHRHIPSNGPCTNINLSLFFHLESIVHSGNRQVSFIGRKWAVIITGERSK